jgi:hypothetical protein
MAQSGYRLVAETDRLSLWQSPDASSG